MARTAIDPNVSSKPVRMPGMNASTRAMSTISKTKRTNKTRRFTLSRRQRAVGTGAAASAMAQSSFGFRDGPSVTLAWRLRRDRPSMSGLLRPGRNRITSSMARQRWNLPTTLRPPDPAGDRRDRTQTLRTALCSHDTSQGVRPTSSRSTT
jgi:hypothetical protein